MHASVDSSSPECVSSTDNPGVRTLELWTDTIPRCEDLHVDSISIPRNLLCGFLPVSEVGRVIVEFFVCAVFLMIPVAEASKFTP